MSGFSGNLPLELIEGRQHGGDRCREARQLGLNNAPDFGNAHAFVLVNEDIPKGGKVAPAR